MAELLDAKPSPAIERQIRAIASKVPGVVGLEKCDVRKVGFSYYVNLHVVVSRTISVSQGHGIAHEVEDTVLRSAPRVAEVLVHVEPDDKDHLAKLSGS
jgi:divalent metal cation (Fe/Co/Zn/Cd) transporter